MHIFSSGTKFINNAQQVVAQTMIIYVKKKTFGTFSPYIFKSDSILMFQVSSQVYSTVIFCVILLPLLSFAISYVRESYFHPDTASSSLLKSHLAPKTRFPNQHRVKPWMGHTKVMSHSKKSSSRQKCIDFYVFNIRLYMSRLSESNVKIFILQHDSISLNRVTTTTRWLYFIYIWIILLILLRNVVYLV